MDNSAKIKKNYKLMGTESDPVIIAQRLLNLYRQLHIFSPEKKEAYNKMLLEQPPEIKRMLSSLPGGIVVQEYISDLEAEAGITVEHFDDDSETQGYNAAADDYAPSSSAPVRNTSDPEIIKGIVEAFKEVIETSEKNRKEDTKELAQTIVALQSKLMQSAGGRVGPGASVASGVDNLPRLEEIIAGISKAQGELIKEMAQAQTQELSQLISRVLKEIQQMSTQTLIDAVQTVHRENMDFFKNQIFSSVSMVPMSSKMAERKTQFEYEQNRKEEVHIDDLPDEAPVSLEPEDEQVAEEIAETINEPEPVSPMPASAETDTADIPPADDEPETTVTENPDEGDYEWEYVEDDSISGTEAETPSAEVSQDNADDYEWEYVEDDGSGDDASVTEYIYADDGASTTEYTYADDGTVAETDEGDYEWEYVEDDGSEDGAAAVAEESVIVPETRETDPYNPDFDIKRETADNPLFSHNDNIVFKSEDTSSDGITLDDSFGLSSNDDISVFPR